MVMQHKLLSKMLGAHVGEGLESGNRTGNKLFFLILRCLENRDEESTFFAPCVSKDQFLSTVWIHSLYCARRIFYYKLLRGNPFMSSFLHQPAKSQIVRKSFPFLHTAKKYPKVRFCLGGEGEVFSSSQQWRLCGMGRGGA